MSDFIKSFEKKNRPQFQKYSKYFKDTDWSVPVIERNEDGKIIFHKYYTVKDVKFGDTTFEGKEGEYRVQQKIAETILNRLKHFSLNTTPEERSGKKATSLINQMLKIINTHIKRIDDIMQSTSFTAGEGIEGDDKKTEKDYKSDEIAFDNLIYKDQTSLIEGTDKINLETKKSEDTSGIQFLDNVKAPLSMHHVLVDLYPEIKKKVEAMGIDFESPPKNEMLIHIEDKPVWDEDKHYFEQDKKTLQFYVDEYKKIRRGITIDGVHISPWLYCHLNIFHTPIPVPKKNELTGEMGVEDVIMNPPLRDNEYYIIQDNYYEAKRQGTMMFLCATRRAAKTTLISSHLYHKLLEMKRVLVVAGGSAKDLGQIEANFKIAISKAHPAFAAPTISDDWTKDVKIGIKKKNQKDILIGELNVVNLNSGGAKSSERLAGFTPDAFVLDECMKQPFLDQLNAAKPAFDSPYGKRLVAILSGTGSSNDDLVKDAIQVLARPEEEGILPMNYEALERGVPEEGITWKRRKFGTFLPGQMSAKEGMVKIEKTLPEYLGIPPTKNLDRIKILVTDWIKAKDIIKSDRKKLEGNKKSLKKETVYYPMDPEEIFLSGKTNPFPHEEINKYIKELEETGDVGKKVILEYDSQGNIQYELSDKEYAEYPYGGGFHDAPVTIFQDPLPEMPWEFCIVGLDDYKQEQADSDSLGSFVVLRRDTREVVASFHSRPDPHSKFHRQGYMLMQMYNCPVFMENADMDLKTYLDNLGYHVSDKYLLKAVTFLGDMTMDNNQRREYGWNPTTKNKSYLLGIAINFSKEEITSTNEEGNPITRLGFRRIKDIRILKDMANFRPDGNYDALTAFMSALAYDYYLTVNYGAPVLLSPEQKAEKERRLREWRANKKAVSIFPSSKTRSWRK